MELLAQATPRLLNPFTKTDLNAELKLDQDIAVEGHGTIAKVTIKKKADDAIVDDERKSERVEQGLEYLAEHMVEPHAQVEPQRPAIPVDEAGIDEYAQADVQGIDAGSEQLAASQSEQNEAAKPTKKKVTK